MSDRRLPLVSDPTRVPEPHTPDGAVRHVGTTPGGTTSTESLHIALDALNPEVHRIVPAVSVDGGHFPDVQDLVITATTTSPATG